MWIITFPTLTRRNICIPTCWKRNTAKGGGLHEVAILKDLSDRRVAYCMFHHAIAWLERGGPIEEIL
ncbi:hypothetical protein [Peribacillus simplex]|uniref:hypothetical protein n=1 Tax=Peribacillus simplex TaxID=1478 RepID=UPI0028533722|nr:hypothetical protein [Peribacillus simplex]MDR4927774.1 hypothetical protein [Peribacillus simplex]